MPDPKNGKGKMKQRVIELQPSRQPKLGRLYSNFMQISHSPWDFTIRFCDAPPGDVIPKSEKSVKFEVPTIVEIIFPVSVAPSLIKALQGQYEKYNKTYGKKE